jgi:hypothetical protein
MPRWTGSSGRRPKRSPAACAAFPIGRSPGHSSARRSCYSSRSTSSLIWTVYLSFTNFRANRPSEAVEWVGLRNYERILTDEDIWLNMQATVHFLF